MLIGSSHLIGLSLVLTASLLETAAQVVLKLGAQPGGGGPHMLGTRRGRWCSAIAISFFVVEGAVWTMALQRLDLSIAQPAGSLTFVLVAFASRIVLKEHISPRRWLGICLILLGVAAVGAS